MISLFDLGLTFVAGLLASLTPCILPLLAIVVGGATQKNRHYVVFMALGVVSAYAVFGVVTGFVDPLFGIQQDYFQVVAGWLFILVGVVVLFPHVLAPVQVRLQAALGGVQIKTMDLVVDSNFSAFGLGGLLAMAWSPCAGPMLGSALLIVSTEPGALRGGLLLGAYGVGATLPLVILAYIARHKIDGFLSKAKKNERFIRRTFAISIVLLGVGLVSGLVRQIEGSLLQAIPLEVLAWLYQF